MFLFLPGFGTGVTLASFHSFGILPVESERLMRFESGRAVLQAVCFNIFADTPSYPVDLLVSRVVNRSYTDSSVDNYSCFGQFSAGRFGSRASGRFVKGGKS